MTGRLHALQRDHAALVQKHRAGGRAVVAGMRPVINELGHSAVCSGRQAISAPSATCTDVNVPIREQRACQPARLSRWH